MKALLIDAAGDLDTSARTLQLTRTSVEYVKQRVAQRLSGFLGEFFLDQRQGVPWFQLVLIKNPDQGLIKSVIGKVVLGTAGVTALRDITVTLNTGARTCEIAWAAEIETGEIVRGSTPIVLVGDTQ